MSCGTQRKAMKNEGSELMFEPAVASFGLVPCAKIGSDVLDDDESRGQRSRLQRARRQSSRQQRKMAGLLGSQASALQRACAHFHAVPNLRQQSSVSPAARRQSLRGERTGAGSTAWPLRAATRAHFRDQTARKDKSCLLGFGVWPCDLTILLCLQWRPQQPRHPASKDFLRQTNTLS